MSQDTSTIKEAAKQAIYAAIYATINLEMINCNTTTHASYWYFDAHKVSSVIFFLILLPQSKQNILMSGINLKGLYPNYPVIF